MADKKNIKNPSTIKERKGNKRTGVIKLPDTQTLLKQPRLITFMRSDYTVMMMRALIVILEQLQPAMELSLNNKDICQLELFNSSDDKVRLSVPIKSFGISPSNYNVLKESLAKLATVPVELDTKDPLSGEAAWRISGLFDAIIPKNAYSRNVTIEMRREIAETMVNMEDGFTKYIKEIAFNARSKYTIQMYMLLSTWKDRGGFSMKMENFREHFRLNDKYPNYNDLYKRVIKVAYDELFEKSDLWFEVAEKYQKGNSEPTRLDFKIIRGILSPKEQDELERTRQHIRQMLYSHLKLDENTLASIDKLVTFYNQKDALTKTAAIITYVKEHSLQIKNVNSYVLVSLRGSLAVEYEAEDEEDFGSEGLRIIDIE